MKNRVYVLMWVIFVKYL